MTEIWLLRAAVIALYVLGGCVTSAWAHADGRINAPFARANILFWPFFALIGSIWGIALRIRKHRRKRG